MDPYTPNTLIQPLIEALIKLGVARGLQEAARQLVSAFGVEAGAIEKFDRGAVETLDRGSHKLVVLQSCPFSEVKKQMGEWSPQAQQLTASYNKVPAVGGGAFDPICIIHRYARVHLEPDDIVQLGCASPKAVIVAEKECTKIGISTDEARELLDGRACLYALRKV